MLEIQPGLFIWTIVNFLVLMLIMGKLFLPKILKFINDREEGIQNNIETANQRLIDAQAKFDESQAKLDQAYQEMSAIIAKGKEQADANVSKSLTEGEEAKRAKIDEAIREIDMSKNQAISEIRSQVADLVIEITEKVINQKLNKADHASLIESYINKLPEHKN